MSDDQPVELEEQERVEILEEIDKLITTNRLPVSEDMEKLKPQKSGLGFPLIINLFAIAAVLSTFYFSNRLFEQKQETLSMENATYQSAEGKLLEELKKESAEQLEKKEQEIGAIQEELAELDRQSRQLSESMDQQIADREAELRLSLEAELEVERRKLMSQGKSEAAIELELNRIEEQRSAEYEAELASFRAATEEEIAAKEEELAMARQLNTELLAEVNTEKERIQDETRKRETELTAQYEAEKAALADEAASAEAELEKLTTNQARESLIIDQINGSYESVFALIEDENFEQAAIQIESLKQLIEDPTIASLKAVGARSGNDRAMLELLQNKIEEQSYKEDSDTRSLAAAAELLLSAQEIVELGTAAYSEGRIDEAENYYTRALEKIPAIRQAWKNIENISSAAETERLSELITKAGALVEEGRQAEAIEQFSTAAAAARTANPDLLNQAISGIVSSAEAVLSAKTGDRDSTIAALEEQNTKDSRQFDQKLEETERSYIAQLADAEAAYSSLETAKADEQERLTRLIGERDQENLRLSAEKEEVEATLSSAKEEITAITSRLEEYRDLSSAEIAQLNSESAAEIEQLREDLTAAELKYQELSSSFAAEQEVAANRLKASEVTGYNNGMKQGRVDAFRDIIDFTSYLDGSSSFNSGAETSITELASREPGYEQAVQKIQQLAASGGPESAAAVMPVKQNILIGSISSASGNSIIIEPLTDMVIEPGTRITINRRERGAEEYYITFGIVTSATLNKISARTDPSGTVPARSMDLVYITN